MKKALLFQGRLVEVAAAAFPVSPEMQWVDVADGVTAETHQYDGTAVVVNPPRPAAEINVARRARIQGRLALSDASSVRALRELLLDQSGVKILSVPQRAAARARLKAEDDAADALRAQLS